MLKKAGDTPSRVTLGMRCKTCIHFQKTPAFERVCTELGIEANATACPSFTPDIVKLRKVGPDVFEKLRDMTKDLRREELNILTFALRNVDLLKKTDLRFGQTVAFSLSGADYLAEFVRGYVIGASVNGDQVYIASTLNGKNQNSNAMLTLMRSSIYIKEEYEAHRKELIEAQRIKPRKGRMPLLIDVLGMPKAKYEELMGALNAKNDYVPPTLDCAPKEYVKKAQEKNKGGLLPNKRGRKASAPTSKVKVVDLGNGRKEIRIERKTATKPKVVKAAPRVKAKPQPKKDSKRIVRRIYVSRSNASNASASAMHAGR